MMFHIPSLVLGASAGLGVGIYISRKVIAKPLKKLVNDFIKIGVHLANNLLGEYENHPDTENKVTYIYLVEDEEEDAVHEVNGQVIAVRDEYVRPNPFRTNDDNHT